MRSNAGFSNLTLILVIAALFIMLLTGILAFISLNTRQSTLVVNTQKTMFMAEGHLFETVRHLLQDPSWPPNLETETYTDRQTIDDTEIVRTIWQEEQTSNGNIIKDIIRIHVTAISKNVSRKFEGVLTTTSSTTTSESPSNQPTGAITHDQITYMAGNTFTVQPGHSYIPKRAECPPPNTSCSNSEKLPAYKAWINTTPNPVTVPATTDTKQRRWSCSGICPNFTGYHGDRVTFSNDPIGPGFTVVLGWPAILDDDLDARRNGIVINQYVAHSCNVISPTQPCEFIKPDYLEGTDHLGSPRTLNVTMSTDSTQIKINNTLVKECAGSSSSCRYNDIPNTAFFDDKGNPLPGWEPVIEVKSVGSSRQVYLDRYPLKICPEGLITPPCTYTLKDNESGIVQLFIDDSLGIESHYGFPTVVGSGETVTEFFYREIEPSPEDFL